MAPLVPSLFLVTILLAGSAWGQSTAGCSKLHDDVLFEYFKCPIDGDVAMVEGATTEWCGKKEMKAVCSASSACGNTDETMCQVTPLETVCNPKWTMTGIAKAVCGIDESTWPAQKCPQLEGVFTYMKGLDGSDYGVIGGKYVFGKDHSYGQNGTTHFALCTKKI